MTMSSAAVHRPIPLSASWRTIYAMALASLFGAMVLIAYIGLVVAYPRKLITVTRQPMQIMKSPAVFQAGEPVSVLFEYCKATDRASLNGVMLWSRGRAVQLPVYVAALPKGCHRVGLTYELPRWLPDGSWKLYLVKEYRPSIFEDVQIVAESDPFQVVPGPASK